MTTAEQNAPRGATLVGLYALFAVIATIANLGAQRVVLAGVDGALAGAGALAAAILVGTAVGLAVKYVLDKRWIFHDRRGGVAHHTATFGLYSLMGVATTAIFWGFEASFWFIWGTDLMREVGAVIGLTIGYVTKYHLDKRFVFTSTEAAR